MLQLDNILENFNTTKRQLEEYNEQCETELAEADRILKEAQQKKNAVSFNKARATKAHKQITKIVG